jgi:hypothetical protein
MPPCTGYNRSCWFGTTAKDPTGKFCIACLKASDADHVETYLASPDFRTGNPDQILAAFATPPFTRLQSLTTSTVISKILEAIHAHPQRHPLLLKYIQQASAMASSAFTFLAYDHSHGIFCKCYPALLLASRDAATPFPLPHPRRCLRCILHTVLYQPSAAGFDSLYFSQQFTQICANALEWQPDGFDLLVRFAAETPPHYATDFRRFAKQIFLRARRPEGEHTTWEKAVSLHPLSLKQQTTYTKEQRDSIKARIAGFKEELVMRTWAPHRLMPWCLDIEDLRDISDP